MIDLLESGRTAWIEAYSCPSNESPSTGKWVKLDGVRGGKLSWKYYSTTKASGQLDLVRASLPVNRYIRVYYCMSLRGEEERDLLGTYYADPDDGQWENGLYTGKVKLVSMLQRYEDYLLDKPMTIGYNVGKSQVLEFFRTCMKKFGGEYLLDVHDKQVLATTTFDFGTKAMDVLQKCADWCGGEISVNEYGQLTLYKYKKNGESNSYFPAVIGEIDESGKTFGIPNTATVMYVSKQKETDTSGKTQTVETQKYGSARLASALAGSEQKVGRVVSRTYKLNPPMTGMGNTSEATKTVLDNSAKRRLSSAVRGGMKYEFRSPYSRVRLHNRIGFMRVNDDGKSTYSYGVVTSIEMDLSGPMGVMTLVVSSDKDMEQHTAELKERGQQWETWL